MRIEDLEYEFERIQTSGKAKIERDTAFQREMLRQERLRQEYVSNTASAQSVTSLYKKRMGFSDFMSLDEPTEITTMIVTRPDGSKVLMIYTTIRDETQVQCIKIKDGDASGNAAGDDAAHTVRYGPREQEDDEPEDGAVIEDVGGAIATSADEVLPS